MPERTRQQHLDWAKSRALELANQGNTLGALDSIASDLQKHPETQGHLAPQLGLQLYIIGELSTTEEMVHFIEGFS